MSREVVVLFVQKDNRNFDDDDNENVKDNSEIVSCVCKCVYVRTVCLNQIDVTITTFIYTP